MKNRIFVLNEDGTFTSFASMNELIDSDEKNVRAYLAQKDEFKQKNCRKKELEKKIQEHQIAIADILIELNKFEESTITILGPQDDWD